MVVRGRPLQLSGRVRGFMDNLNHQLRDHETIPEFIQRMHNLIMYLPQDWNDPLTRIEAAYIVIANLPYEEPWRTLIDDFLGRMEDPDEDAQAVIEYEGTLFWSLDDLEAVLIYHYIRWRNDSIRRGVPRARVLRYGEQEEPAPEDVFPPRVETPPRREESSWRCRPRKRKRDDESEISDSESDEKDLEEDSKEKAKEPEEPSDGESKVDGPVRTVGQELEP